MAMVAIAVLTLFCLVSAYLPTKEEKPQYQPTPEEMARIQRAMQELVEALQAVGHSNTNKTGWPPHSSQPEPQPELNQPK